MRKFEYAKDNPYGDFGLPRRSTKNAAGYYFIAPYDFTVKPNETVLVKTFVKCKMPPDFYLKIYARSSWGVKRHMEMRYSGIIDADYYGNPTDDGNITLAIHNFGDTAQHVSKGEKICQGIFMKYYRTEDDDADGTRVGAFGSTGK